MNFYFSGSISQLLRRLSSEGLSPAMEEHLLRMKDIIFKLHRHKLITDQNKPVNDQAVAQLAAAKTRFVDLHSTEMLMKAMVYYAQMQLQQPVLLDTKMGDPSSANFVQMNAVISQKMFLPIDHIINL